ncbi:MAG: GatB/YqeY domain-containing protein [Tepidisphaeraceae bacterium]
MELLVRLQEDMKTAMKSGAKDRLMVIRMLLNEVRNIDLNPAKPSAEQAVAAYAKKLRKSIDEYEKLGKPDEVAKLRAEILVAEQYLPRRASDDETAGLVDAFLAQNSFTEKQLGQAMGAFMKNHGTQVDAALANRLLRQKLSGR